VGIGVTVGVGLNVGVGVSVGTGVSVGVGVTVGVAVAITTVVGVGAATVGAGVLVKNARSVVSGAFIKSHPVQVIRLTNKRMSTYRVPAYCFFMFFSFVIESKIKPVIRISDTDKLQVSDIGRTYILL
jgi:hypothetical protein